MSKLSQFARFGICILIDKILYITVLNSYLSELLAEETLAPFIAVTYQDFFFSEMAYPVGYQKKCREGARRDEGMIWFV